MSNLPPTPDRPSHHRLFTLLGVRWEATPYAWINVLLFILAGVIIALALEPDAPIWKTLLSGVGYGLLVYLTYVLHGVGHTIGGKIFGAPMDANLITTIRHINVYTGDQSAYSKRVHIGRALGGPAINLLAGVAALGLWARAGGRGLWLFSAANLITGAAALLPIPSIDGWVVWGELLGFRRR